MLSPMPLKRSVSAHAIHDVTMFVLRISIVFSPRSISTIFLFYFSKMHIKYCFSSAPQLNAQHFISFKRRVMNIQKSRTPIAVITLFYGVRDTVMYTHSSHIDCSNCPPSVEFIFHFSFHIARTIQWAINVIIIIARR